MGNKAHKVKGIDVFRYRKIGTPNYYDHMTIIIIDTMFWCAYIVGKCS